MEIRPNIGANYFPVAGKAAHQPVAVAPEPHDHGLQLDPSRQRLFTSTGKSLSFPTDGSVFSVGRLPESAVCVTHTSVSRHHADGKWQDGQLWIRDKNSTYGTMVDGRKVEPGQWVAVPDGSRLTLGDATQPPLVLGVGGSVTIMHRLDALQKSPEPLPFRLRTGDGKSVEIPSDGRTLEVGRETGADLQVDSHLTSRKHAQLRWEGDQLLVQDLGSTNGTFVNGEKIQPKQWVPVPQGGQLQFGNTPNSQVAFEAKSPLVVTFFGDGSVPDIGGEVKAQPRRFERALSNNNAPAIVRGMVAQGSILKDAGMTALPVAMGTAGVGGLVALGAGAVASVVGGPLGIPLMLWGASMAGIGGYGAWNTRHMFKGGLAAIKEKFRGAPAQASPWRHVQHAVVSQGPKLSQFQELWKQNLSMWPSSKHVVFISGHGTQKGAAGLNFEDVGKTVQGAEAIFLDACNGAQIESLAKLSGSARVAVASEHTVRGYGFPLDDMFGRNKFPEDARTMGAALVQAASHGRPAQSLVAVDLHVLKDQLLPSLDRLGQSLQRLSKQGYSEAINFALDNSETTNAGGLSKKVDLGSFLSHLMKAPGVRQLCPELVATEKAFNSTILSMMGHGTISFDRSPGSELPEGWRKFLKSA